MYITVYTHRHTHTTQNWSISGISYVSPPGKTELGFGENLKELFLTENDYIYVCDPERHWGFSVFLIMFPGAYIGEWTKQKCRDLWLLWRQPASFMAWGSRTNTTLSFGSPKRLHRDRYAIALPMQRTSFEGSGGFGVTLDAVASRLQPQRIVLPQEQSCLFPLEQNIEGWGVPNGRGVRTLGLYGQLHSPSEVLQSLSPLLCHTGMVTGRSGGYRRKGPYRLGWRVMAWSGTEGAHGTPSFRPVWLQLICSARVCQLHV